MRRGAGIIRGTVVRAATVASWVRPSLRRSTVREVNVSLVNAAWALCTVPGTRRSERLQLRVLMFERVRSRPSPGAWVECALRMHAWRFGGVPSGTGGDETNLRLLVLRVNPTEGVTRYDCVQVSGHADRNTAGRHKSQRTPGGPGSQGRSALTTGSPGVDSVVAGPTCEPVPVGCCAESASPRLHPRLAHWPCTQTARWHQRDDHASRNSPIVHSEPPSITAAMSSAKSPPMSPTKSRTSPS